MEAIIEQSLDWKRAFTKKGQTQDSEYYYIDVIKKVIQSVGGEIIATAGSQQAVDFRVVRWPDGTTRSYECKKINKGSRFMFNDTFIKSDVWYIFIYVDIKKVRIAKGSDLMKESQTNDRNHSRTHLKNISKIVNDMLDEHNPSSGKMKSLFSEILLFFKECVLNGSLSYFDYGQIFKQTIKFGSFQNRPRPNWSLTIPYKPPSQLEEVPHSPTEQSAPSENPQVDSPVETLESL